MATTGNMLNITQFAPRNWGSVTTPWDSITTVMYLGPILLQLS